MTAPKNVEADLSASANVGSPEATRLAGRSVP
jgi:hypothetical protein